MSRRLTVLVTGATGQQGSAVAEALLAGGHSVRALTRRTSTDAARRLERMGAAVIAGDFADTASLVTAARGVDTAFLMGTPFEAGMSAETAHGIAAIDAAKAAGVGHVVYASVASADRRTGIPHFESKYAVEQHLAASDVPYTISAPVAFMENLVAPWAIGSFLEGTIAFALPPSRRLQQVAVADIGAFVASLVERRDTVFGRRIEIAGDELSGEEEAAILSRATGRPIRYHEVPLEDVRRQSDDTAIMFEWFERIGYSVDIAALRREFPEVKWTTFADWATARDWNALAWAVPASPVAARA
jgi:uncharacterized protein YbjT (DUF2867 family)